MPRIRDLDGNYIDAPSTDDVEDQLGAAAFIHYSEEDPGAVGAGHIWIRADLTPAPFIRNEENTAWQPLAIVVYGGDGTNPTPTAILSHSFAADGGLELGIYNAGGVSILGVSFGATGEFTILQGVAGTNRFAVTSDGTVHIGNNDTETGLQITPAGAIKVVGIGTVNPNVAGQLWNDGGTLKVSAG